MGSVEGCTMTNFVVFSRSPNIFKLIKSRRLKCAGYVARMEEGRSAFKMITVKPTGKRP